MDRKRRLSAGVQRAAIVAATLVISLIIYARGLFTPIGVASFGRTYGWYVNYFDFGFVHRALIGSIVVLFAPGPIANSYAIPTAIYPLFLLAAALSGLLAARRWLPDTAERTRYLAVLLLSPAFIAHYAYSTGDFNVLLAAILISSLLLVRSRFAPFLLLAVAMAIHEIFFVAFAPCVCVAIYMSDGRKLRRSIAYGVAAAALFFLFSHFGTVEMSNEQILAMLNHRANLSVDASLEMTGNLSQNLQHTLPLFSSVAKVAWIIPPLAYWTVVTVLFFPLRQPRFVGLIYLGAVTAPLALFPFGTDLFRWVAMASVAALTLGGFLRSQGCGSVFAARPRVALALTLPWIVFGPFGSACMSDIGCQRAFPMAQFALERL